MGQGQSAGTRTIGDRKINVRNIRPRIGKDLLALLRTEFDRIQEAGTISRAKFKAEVIGKHVPDSIGTYLYKMFASPTLTPDDEESKKGPNAWKQNMPGQKAQAGAPAEYVMTFDDFCAFYIVFKEGKDEDMLQVGFELLKLSPDHFSNKPEEEQLENWPMQAQNGKPNDPQAEFFLEQDLRWLCKMLQVPGKQVREYYASTSFSPNFPVTFENWKSTYSAAKHSPLLTWMPTVVQGLKEENMNLEPDNRAATDSKDLTDQRQPKDSGRQKLTEPASAAKGGSDDEPFERRGSSRFTQAELDNIREFWTGEVKNKPAQEVHRVFQRMFRGMKNQKLKKYILLSVSQVVGLTFNFLAELVRITCKDVDSEERMQFLFTLFAKQGKQMRGQAIKDFIEVFRLPMQAFKLATFLSLDQYLDELQDVDVDYSALTAAKPMIIAMTAITPETDEEEREAIYAAMNGNKNLETFIYETLPEEHEYYVIEAAFWEEWCTALPATSGGYGVKKEHKESIDNKGLMEEMHHFRMKDLTYKQDFVLLPKYVYYPLSKWYSCEKEITRSVIQYRRARGLGESMSAMASSHGSRRFLMSSQKFYNPREGQFEEELVRTKGEFVYELEIYPSILYLGKVTEKGEKPHVKAVVNGRVDFTYLRKVARTDSLPFEELQMSRKTTLQQVLQLAAQTFQENIRKGRLLIEDQIISGTNLYQTLEEFGLRQGQLVYAEFSDSSNEFPTDVARERQTKSPRKVLSTQTTVDSQGKVVPIGATVGLQNLGNTCYMNSALQIFANLRPIHDYFIRYKLHQRQLNMRNPLGFQGKLVYAFSILLERMWQAPNPVVPRNFKSVIGRCSEQFVGFEQQDSQEYISFLIDGLHEELNLRMKKPYIQNPESKNRDLNELGLEQWSNSLLRNWSIIYFLFYGQMRSSLTCRHCRTESTTFDIFSNIPLSLPEPSQQTVSIIVYRVPNRIKDILHSRIVKDDLGNVTLQGFQRIDTEEEQSQGPRFSQSFTQQGLLQRRNSSQSTRDRQHLAQFAESYNYMNNDQPMHVVFKVDIDIKISDLIIKIAQTRELNIEIPMLKTELIVFQLAPGLSSLRGMMNPAMKLSQYNFQGQDIIAAEILTRTGRDAVKKFYMDNKAFVQSHPETVLRCLTYASEKGDAIEGAQGYPAPQNLHTPAHKGMFNSQGVFSNSPHAQQMQRPLTGESEYDSSSYTSSIQSGTNQNIRGLRRPVQKLDRYLVLGQVMQKAFNFDAVESRIELPRDIFVVAYHRRFIRRSEYLFSEYVPQLIATPIIFMLPTVPSGRRIYDEVWASAHVMLRPNTRFHRPTVRWWERKNWREATRGGKGIFAPFVLKAVDRSGLVCGICHWLKKCSGCIVLPTDAPIFDEDFIKKCFLAIEWHSKSLSDGYNHMANEVVEHASTRKKANEVVDQSNYTTLDDCLTKFHKTEQLENEVNCEKCKMKQVHFKRMEIFIPPPVLIIQLKRFRLYGMQWRKLQNLVDFPIRNLDMTGFTSDYRFINDQFQIESTYNLHGIVNHYGTLGFGHYISFVRNPFDDKWYRYDDLYREEVSEDQLHKESAYLLFYVRKDLESKDLTDVLPDIEKDYFSGKPVKYNGLDGFVAQRPPGGASKKVIIKLKSQPLTSTVTIDDLAPEEDKNELKYNANELKFVQKMGRSQNVDSVTASDTKATANCCGLFGKSSSKVKTAEMPRPRDAQIKQATALSSRKPSQASVSTATTAAQILALQRKQPLNESASMDSSMVATPLLALGNEKSPGGASGTPVPAPIRTPTMASPYVTAKGVKVIEAPLHRDEDSNSNMVRSATDFLNQQPRPRFKMNDGAGEQVESVLSHFSQSEINQDSEGNEGGTIDQSGSLTIIIKPRLKDGMRTDQHSSHLETRAGPNLTQQH